MTTNQQLGKGENGYFLQATGFWLIILLLFGVCIGVVACNTFFLTLPRDGEIALIERINQDYCEGRGCNEIQMYNLSRMSHGPWCVNLHIYSPLRAHESFAKSYMMTRTESGEWDMRSIPGSICDTWSFSGRRYLLH